MYEQVKTGPLYDKVVRSMSTYRSIAARMASAKSRTQGKLDRRLESLGDKIAEQLSELSGNELQALTCWKDGIMPDTYEIDHDAITEKPYISIRRIDRWDEEYDVAERKALLKAGDERDETQKKADAAKLRAFLSMTDDT